MTIEVGFDTVNNSVNISAVPVLVELGENSTIDVIFSENDPLNIEFNSQDINIEFTGGAGGSVAQSYDRLSDYDSIDLNYLYTGKALPGSNDADPVWRISRFNMIDGVIEYANGNENFTNVYDDRETLNYS